jgi:hypothetical protein
VAKTRRKAQLRGQQLPAKKGKVRARLVQTAQIQDWDNLTPDQQQEALNWGIDVDISTDLDDDMSGQAGGSTTFTMVASGGGTTGGGGGPPGGGPPGGGGGGGGPPAAPPAGPPAPPPTLDDLTRLMQDVGNAVGILAQQVLDLTRAQNAGRSGTKDAIPRPKAWDGKGGSAEARHFLAAFHNFASAQGTSLNVLDATTGMWTSVPGRWIQAALNLMEADTCTWALPYLEEIQAGNMPFSGVWQTFLEHFTRRFVSRFPLALSPKTKRTRSYTSCESTHVTSGVNTRQTPSNLTGIRTTEIMAWQLDALSSRDRRGSGCRGLSRRSGRVDIVDLHQGR